MRYKFKPSTSLPGILLPAFLLIHAVGAQTISDTVKSVNSHGDNGYWQQGQPDVMILWPEDDQNVITRFTGSAQHPYPYRLWVAADRAGGFPVLLKDESSFNNFLEHIKANDGKDWCQVAETWSAWAGNPPAGCGVHSYTQRKTCSVAAGAEKPCPDLCNPAVQTRTLQVNNGPCKPEPPPPAPDTCSISAWTPSTGTVCTGKRFTQTRTLADCSTDKRTVSGTRSCRQTCSVTAWSPSTSTVCAGESFPQTRTLADCSTDRRTAIGTKSCVRSCTLTAWSPDRNTACIGETLTQTRTLADCSTDRRVVGGTRSCQETCTVTAWSPATSTVCLGETLIQTRTLADCSTGSRTANGTKSCPPTCPATAWSPATSTVCLGETLTQTRTLANCSTESRTVGGTKSCPPTCTATAWSPATNTVCTGETLIQSRTLTDCSTETRTASGTKTCAPTCSYSCVMKTTGGLLGSLWIMYRRCSGDTNGTPVGTYVKREDCYANLP